MKSLDSVITRLLPNGEKHSVGSKCAEMDREVNLIVHIRHLVQSSNIVLLTNLFYIVYCKLQFLILKCRLHCVRSTLVVWQKLAI